MRVSSVTMVRLSLHEDLKQSLINKASAEVVKDGGPEPTKHQLENVKIVVLRGGQIVEADEIEVSW